MKETEISWAAGFFDGEGYIGCHRVKTRKTAKRISISIAQVDPEPLVRFKDAVGTGGMRGPYKQKNPNGSPFYQYHCGGTYKSVLKIFETIGDHLCAPKYNQFIDALNEYEEYQRTTKYTNYSRCVPQVPRARRGSKEAA